jgi:hypothetical protein
MEGVAHGERHGETALNTEKRYYKYETVIIAFCGSVVGADGVGPGNELRLSGVQESIEFQHG